MFRRTLIERFLGLAAAATWPVGCGGAAAQIRSTLRLGPRAPFDIVALRARARALAARPATPPPSPASALLESLDYDAYQRIRPHDDAMLFAGTRTPIGFFHLGRHNRHPVRVHLVEGGSARELRFDRALYEYDDPDVRRAIPADLGFGGFRVLERDRPGDWLAFSGASYFRSAGALDQYGLSARGIAIGTGLPEPEEFPRFSELFLETPDPSAEEDLVIHALLEGTSLTGAYTFRARRERPVRIDVSAALYPRAAVNRLGVAPLTSMFWFSETNRHRAADWRPEIHDSDGLAMWTGSGERLWRPLKNPSAVRTHSYLDHNPRGFGLMQRDRAFDHYQDDGVFYDRRPSLWIEPQGSWGEGEVMLVEIPTDDEIFDNIVAFWHPRRAVTPGDELLYDYRMSWAADLPSFPGNLARVVATRTGRAGVPGQPRPADGTKYVIDFEGGSLSERDREDGVVPVVNASRGRVEGAYALPVVGTSRFRLVFDILSGEGDEVVELRAFLRHGETALSETWIYPHDPFRF